MLVQLQDVMANSNSPNLYRCDVCVGRDGGLKCFRFAETLTAVVPAIDGSNPKMTFPERQAVIDAAFEFYRATEGGVKPIEYVMQAGICPADLIDPEVAEVTMMLDTAQRWGNFPFPGSVADQPAVLIQADRVIQGELNRLRKERMDRRGKD